MMLVGAGLTFGMFLCAKPTQTLVSYPRNIFLCSRGIMHFQFCVLYMLDCTRCVVTHGPLGSCPFLTWGSHSLYMSFPLFMLYPPVRIL